MILMMASMSLWMLIGLLVLLALVAGVAYLAVRAGRPHVGHGDDARAALNLRLATGEISSEEYFERESALRAGEPMRTAPRRR
ncbi:MAG: hypothetical protein ACR2LV_10575 [Solirubrobacteraceae bacterium]